ncbi:hypothetical protein [Crossiella sp. CA198]|uniref:hypothetical protein n=1 Tax=Crossiella sp. CA198 TaxID=3455607 RepID=UPI003F8D667D
MPGIPAASTPPPPGADGHPPLFDLGPKGPPVPGDTGNGGGPQIKVSPDALRKFAENIEQLIPLIDVSVAQLNGVNVRAGSFPNAVNLANSVNAPGRLTDTLTQVFTTGKKTITDTAAAMRKIAADYDKAEDLNTITVSDYGRYVAGAMGDVNTLIGIGDASNPAAKGGGSTD